MKRTQNWGRRIFILLLLCLPLLLAACATTESTCEGIVNVNSCNTNNSDSNTNNNSNNSDSNTNNNSNSSPSLPTLASAYQGTGHNRTYNASGALVFSSITEDPNGNIAGQSTWTRPLSGSGPFTGTVTADNKITFTSRATDGTHFVITFIGTVDRTNHTLSGTYTVNSGAQTGTWQVS